MKEASVITNGTKNVLRTHWTERDLTLNQGLDFGATSPEIFVRMRHLNHEHFFYNLTIINNNDNEVDGTVRIFLTPRLNENGQPLTFKEQSKLKIEMDKFPTRCKCLCCEILIVALNI